MAHESEEDVLLMPRSWLSIRVELVEGRGVDYWPRPGRRFAAARTHTFAELATAIDDAFARWDRSHLHAFELPDGTRIGSTDPDWDDDEMLDGGRIKLDRLASGERFLYVFDFGDDWTHLCTVEADKIDPQEPSGSCLPNPCRISVGATSPINTDGAGTPKSARAIRRPTRTRKTCRLFGLGGESVPGCQDNLRTEARQDTLS